MLHAVSYKVMLGNKRVLTETKLFYNFSEMQIFAKKLKRTYRDDIVYLDIYGPSGVISQYNKYPYIERKEDGN